MQQSSTHHYEIPLVGIQIRTSNRLEMDPSTAQIAITVRKYFSQGLAS
ncbi:MAG: hypothetical protein AAFQ08_01325 [Bacteroidota bacterium]